jgi:hypothetical protein
MSYMRRPRRRYRDTPIGDMLYALGEPLPTWNRHRGHLGMDGKRKPGGEWDYIRALPIRTRRRLTGAGFMAREAMRPDEFADMLRRNVPHLADLGDTDCHAWYVKHALLALTERRQAEHHDRHLAYALASGAPSYYALRDQRARAAGYRSFWHQRKASHAASSYQPAA